MKNEVEKLTEVKCYGGGKADRTRRKMAAELSEAAAAAETGRPGRKDS